MKVERVSCDKVIFGIDVIAEDEIDRKVIDRFWRRGVKVNGMASNNRLQLTFADLVEREDDIYERT